MSRVWGWMITFVIALMAGGVAGLCVSLGYVSPQVQEIEARIRERLDQTTTTKPEVQIIRVEREPVAPLIPALFLQGRRSPVGFLIKRATKPGEDEQAPANERILGSVSALTTDGWLATSANLFDGIRIAEVAVFWEGRVFVPLKVVKDTASDIVYIQIGAQNLPVMGSARSEDIVPGLPVWIEAVPGRLSPHVITDIRERSTRSPVPSERITHRYIANGSFTSFMRGASVWNADGQLVGSVETGDASGIRIIPIIGMSGALSSLLLRQDIRHPSLGIVGAERGAGEQGFVIRADRARGLVAVDPKGPSANILKEGDILERIDREVLDGTADLGERLLEYRPGTTLTIYARRAGQPFEAKVTLGSVTTSEVLK